MTIKYKKLLAFTLAEVLITLTIIGVIASLTIPALLQNINKQDLRTQWKAAYSICDQATKRALMDNGGDFTGVFQNTTDMKNKLKGYFNYTKECALGQSVGNCWPLVIYNKDGSSSANWDDVPALILNNGMFIRFWSNDDASATNCTESVYYKTGECGAYEVDVNGFKGPNRKGEDIFFIHILSDKIRPAGVPETTGGMQYCSTTYGVGCGALYLMQ